MIKREKVKFRRGRFNIFSSFGDTYDSYNALKNNEPSDNGKIIATLIDKIEYAKEEEIFPNGEILPINWEPYQSGMKNESYQIICVKGYPMSRLIKSIAKKQVTIEQAEYIIFSHPTARLENWIPEIYNSLLEIREKMKPDAKIVILDKACSVEATINANINNAESTNQKKQLEDLKSHIIFIPDHSVEELGNLIREKFSKTDIKSIENLKEEYIIYDDYLKQLNIWPADGCRKKCGYCRRCYMEYPKFKSVPLKEIKKVLDYYKEHEPEKLAQISLRAENLTEYGYDLNSGERLNDLIDLLNSYDDIKSIESPIGLAIPEITDKILKALCNCKKIKFLSIDLEAGTDKLLEMIGRGVEGYEHPTERSKEIFEKLHKENPEVKIASKILVGFPGETDDDMKKTANFVGEASPDVLEILSYKSAEGQLLQKREDKLEDEIKIDHEVELYNRIIRYNKFKKTYAHY